MIPGVVASWSARATGAASLSVTLTGQAIASGDLIHVETYVFSNLTVSPATPTDGTNAYTALTPSTWSSIFRTVVGAAWSIATAGVGTITVAPNAGTADIAGVVYHVALPVTPNPINTNNANTIATTQTPVHTAASTAAPPELWFLGATHDGAAPVATPPSGFKVGQMNFDGSAGEPYGSLYGFFTGPQSSLALAWDVNSAANFSLCLTAYKMAATLPEVAMATHVDMIGR